MKISRTRKNIKKCFARQDTYSIAQISDTMGSSTDIEDKRVEMRALKEFAICVTFR